MPGHIVFVRFLQRYSDSFPHERVLRLKDSEIAEALEALGKEWWSKPANREAIRASRTRAAKAQLESEAQIRAWSEGWLVRPGTDWSFLNQKARKDSSRTPIPKGTPRFEEIAAAADWLRELAIGDWFPPHGISAFYPVARFDSEDIAAGAAIALQARTAELAEATGRKTRLEKEDWLFVSANPRFVVLGELDHSFGELAAAREQLQRIQGPPSGNITPEEGFVRAYLPMIRPVLDQIKAHAAVGDSGTCENSPNDATPSRADRRSAPSPRLVFHDESRTIVLDGVPDACPLEPDCYQFLKVIGRKGDCGNWVPGRTIKDAPGLASKKLDRVLKKLPRKWRKLIKSRCGSGGGYCLTLDPKVVPECP